MPLMRGFAKVQDEGRVQVPTNLRRQMGLLPGEPFVVDVVRINGTGRWPHLFLHHRGTAPFISPHETLFRRGAGRIAADGSLTLPDEIIEEARLSPGCLLEIKLMGAANAPWSVVHNRGVRRVTTLQGRLGTSRRRGTERDRDTFVLEY